MFLGKTHEGRRKFRGFTLIELLVVIAIIAILAAILFPVFARARENARRSSCQSNLKQIGLGILQYSQDYDENWVPKDFWRDGSGVTPSWRQSVQPYVKSTQLFSCPSNPNNKNTADNAIAAGATPFAASPAIPVSYACNTRMIDENGGRNLSEIQEPAKKILVAENTRDWKDYGASWWNNETDWRKESSGGSGFAGHLGTANYLFADGHVKAMRPTQTASPVNLWGQMGDPGCCRSDGYSPNVDTVDANMLKGMQNLENDYK